MSKKPDENLIAEDAKQSTVMGGGKLEKKAQQVVNAHARVERIKLDLTGLRSGHQEEITEKQQKLQEIQDKIIKIKTAQHEFDAKISDKNQKIAQLERRIEKLREAKDREEKAVPTRDIQSPEITSPAISLLQRQEEIAALKAHRDKLLVRQAQLSAPRPPGIDLVTVVGGDSYKVADFFGEIIPATLTASVIPAVEHSVSPFPPPPDSTLLVALAPNEESADKSAAGRGSTSFSAPPSVRETGLYRLTSTAPPAVSNSNSSCKINSL